MLMFSSSSYAMTGNELHNWINEDSANKGWMYYIMGVIDGQGFYKAAEIGQAEVEKRKPHTISYLCLPEGYKHGQGFDVVKKYLASNPEQRHEHAVLLIYKSMLDVWRCPT